MTHRIHNPANEYKDTIDWNLYWKGEAPTKEMVQGARNMASRIGKFIDKHRLKAIADFGCGPGLTLFLLAEMHPELAFDGFDSSVSVIKKSQSKATKMGLTNLRFDHEMLPAIKTRKRFDLIYSIATLYYVRDNKKAVRNLYDRLNDGGFLIFNYPNRYSMQWYRNWIKPDELEKRKRFSLVLNGENLLSLKEIEKVIGRRPNNFWSAVGEKKNKENMCIYVGK